MQDLFYNKMMADDRVNFFFNGVDMKQQRAHQVSHPACLLTGSGVLSTLPLFKGLHGAEAGCLKASHQMIPGKLSSLSRNGYNTHTRDRALPRALSCTSPGLWPACANRPECGVFHVLIAEEWQVVRDGRRRNVCMLWPLTCCTF